MGKFLALGKFLAVQAGRDYQLHGGHIGGAHCVRGGVSEYGILF